MRRSFLLLLSFAPCILAAQDFIMQAGSLKTLTPEERTLSLGKFVLGDNVTIYIPREMDGWTVTASDVSIGKNVKIIAYGSDVNLGASGSSGASAMECMKGMDGMNAAFGANSSPGKNVSLNLKIRSIGSLTITVNGTAGGIGGNGGNGGNGGRSTCNCNGGAGGNGGVGGRGGNGGNGGNVSIIYSKIGEAQVSNSNFIVQNAGGAGGKGGRGGNAGVGGKGGGCSDPKSAARPAGANGRLGANGPNGTAGRNGTTTINSQ